MLSTTCTPQHIPCSPHYVLHFILCLCCGCMLWTTLSYVVDYMFANVVHNIYMFSTTYDMLWSTFAVFHYVPHNIHPQYIESSTTYTHNICPWICCGCMLWITTSICCGVHMLWSVTTFNDVHHRYWSPVPVYELFNFSKLLIIFSCLGLFKIQAVILFMFFFL